MSAENPLRATLGNGDDDLARLLLRAFRAVTAQGRRPAGGPRAR